jgi:hypothetical protein
MQSDHPAEFKPVAFVTACAVPENIENSCVTNPWQNSVWFWQVFGHLSTTGQPCDAQHHVKWAPRSAKGRKQALPR